jgi:hypothetical protein
LKDGHIAPERAWPLVANVGVLTPMESAHLRECLQCNGWLSNFVRIGEEAGLEVKLQIPELSNKPSAAPDSN